jgi:hypothetical protein
MPPEPQVQPQQANPPPEPEVQPRESARPRRRKGAEATPQEPTTRALRLRKEPIKPPISTTLKAKAKAAAKAKAVAAALPVEQPPIKRQGGLTIMRTGAAQQHAPQWPPPAPHAGPLTIKRTGGAQQQQQQQQQQQPASGWAAPGVMHGASLVSHMPSEVQQQPPGGWAAPAPHRGPLTLRRTNTPQQVAGATPCAPAAR